MIILCSHLEKQKNLQLEHDCYIITLVNAFSYAYRLRGTATKRVVLQEGKTSYILEALTVINQYKKQQEKLNLVFLEVED
jgi:hypothetical protein